MQEQRMQETELDLPEYCRALWKRKKLIIGLVVITAFSTTVASLFSTDIYEATAVITTASDQDPSGSSALQMLSSSGLGGIAGMAGISLPGGQGLNELEQFLKSNVVREKVIVKYNLLPVLLYKQWDEEKKEWKQPGWFERTMKAVSRVIAPKNKKTNTRAGDGNPTLWDGLRSLQKGIVTIKTNKKENTLTIAVDYHDPEIAASMVNNFLETLQDHLSDEKKRNANENRKYLEVQLVKAADPVTRQKIYALLSKQVETALMAEVKGNIFKIIDPPRVPDRKIKPKRAQLVVLSAFLAAFIGVLIAFFLEYLEKVRKSS
jgi:uncharacterized protein involved in exopolysaccharide biosynthesis